MIISINTEVFASKIVVNLVLKIIKINNNSINIEIILII